jgi:anti-anti-sigma factor
MSEPPDTYTPPPPPFTVTVQSGDRAMRVAISGEIDIKTIGPIEGRIQTARSQAADRHLILDLRELTFMDSSGLRLLIALLRDAQARAHRLTVVRPPRDVFRPIQLTGLDKVLDFVEHPSDAELC